VVHANEKEHLGEFRLEDLVQDFPDTKHPKVFIEGKDIRRWKIFKTRYIEWGTRRAPAHFRRPTFPEMYEVPEKLITARSPGAEPKTSYDLEQTMFDASSVGFIPWNSLCSIQNRSISKSAKYKTEAKGKKVSECREDLEVFSKRFNIKYLLAVMNSSWAREFLRHNRRSNIHLYPDDWKKLPIPDVDMNVQKAVAAKVEAILKALKKKVPFDELEQEVDEMVSALYRGETI
jgi:adenine-specific DNA-methyltransferase